MKIIKSIVVSVLLIASVNVFAQSNAKVVAIVNKADWCSICKAYAGRTVETFTKNNSDSYFEFIVNDITNEDSQKASKPSIQKFGLSKVASNSTAAGVLSFYNPSTKELIMQVTVANSPEEITYVMSEVRKRVK